MTSRERAKVWLEEWMPPDVWADNFSRVLASREALVALLDAHADEAARGARNPSLDEALNSGDGIYRP